MAEALKIKVSVDKYQETLNNLTTILGKLTAQKDKLKRNLQKMDGAVFSGTDVQKAIDLCKEELKRTENGIAVVQEQRRTIQKYLDETRVQQAALDSNVASTSGKLPDLFA